MKLHSLTNTVKRANCKRVGRGSGSQGKTCGRGNKGYGARAGSHSKSGFEGGQIPLFRRLPKRGFKNPNHVEYTIVNTSIIDENFKNGDVVDRAALFSLGLINDEATCGLKVLANGDITKAVTVIAERFSEAAVQKIEQAGGTCKTI